jgi:endonuclease-3
MRHAHHWLILHGRYVCQARKPRCDLCIVSDLCRSPDKRLGGPPPAVDRKVFRRVSGQQGKAQQ